MPEQFLTLREFDNWREQHDTKIDKLVEASEVVVEAHQDMKIRLTRVETRQDTFHDQHAARVGVVSAVIAAIVGGLVGWFPNR
jgi:hypothetical protein